MPDLDQEYEALSKELRSTNLQLGLPEFDGLGSPVDAEYEALSRELAMLPQTYDEWLAEEREKDKRSAWQATKTFASNILTGANAMLDEGKKAVGEVVGGKAEWKDVKRGVWDLGRHDFWRFAETLGGAAMDKLWGTGAEAEGRREYQRYRENFDYYQKVRPAIVEATGTKAKALVRTLGEFTDPTMIIPIAGPTLKVAAAATKSARLAKLSKALDKSAEIVSMPARGTAAVTRKAIKGTAAVTGKLAGVGGRAGGLAAKAAALPRTITSRVAKELGMERDIGGALIAGQISGAIAGLPFVSSFGAVEVAGLIANKTGRGLEKVLSTLSQPSGQVRFLERLARTAETPRRRKLALLAHKMGFTRAGDAAFNMLVNGVSVGTLNAALAYASGERAEGIGQAVGAGAVMGGVMPFGQPGQVGGKAQTSREATSINYLEAKWASDQLKDFRGMTPEARLAFATSEEAGIRAPGVTFVDKKIMLELQRQDDPNSREPQNAFWDETNYRIYVNRDGSMKKGSIEAMEILFHELGHTFTAQAAKDDPFFLRSILTEYEAEPGEKSYRFSFTKDRDGNPIDYVDVNQEGKDFADAYSSTPDLGSATTPRSWLMK